MLQRAVGVVIMLDGVMSALAVMPKLNTFVYRDVADRSLIVAHLLLGAILLLAGRQTWRGEWRQFSAAAIIAAFVLAAIEVTRFDRVTLLVRAIYTAGVLWILRRRPN